jgi:tetratricopeptide (TPR) repeat protein
MRRAKSQLAGIPRLIAFGILGLFAGGLVADEWNPLPIGSRTHVVPAPYRLAKIPGGTALRLAMVHDVLHERYLCHGWAWYTQRNLDSRKIIAEEKPNTGFALSPRYLDALDDLAVGLERTGELAEAIAVMQKKLLALSPLPTPPTSPPAFDASHVPAFDDVDRRDLERMTAAQNLAPLQHHQYTAFANLGTFLLLDAFSKMQSGNLDSATRSEIHQSLDYIERALAINPAGHFGREVWQAIAIEHLVASFDHPDLLEKYDMIGEPLDDSSDHVRPFVSLMYSRRAPDTFDPNLPAERRLGIRENIARVGIDPAWAAQVNPDYPCSMPFDEPTLAIVGMWTMGGGPNPHFALALGRIMQTLGQRNIAWNAYERAIELRDQFSPDSAIRAKLVALCQARQSEIAGLEAPDTPAAWADKMRAQHAAELAWGLAYQKEYQDFEASQIAAGVPLNESGFYSKFFQTRDSIASFPGLSDDIIVTHVQARSLGDVLPCLILGLGIGMVLGLVIPERILP